MAITFRGRDLVVRFKENELNGAERMYQIRYQCATNMVVHNVDVNDFYEQDATTQLRRYVDTLRYDENVANGLTRAPIVSMRTQNANGVFSAWQLIEASNPLPVLVGTPLVEPTLTGVQIRVVQPDDDDLVGFAVWVSRKPGVPMTEGYLRHQGGSTSIDIPLASDDTYYMRIAPYDAFGLDPAAAFPEMEIKRRPLGGDIINSPPWRQLPNLVGELLTGPIDELSALHIDFGTSQLKAAVALNKENLVAVREIGTRLDEKGNLIAEDVLNLTTRVDDAEAGLLTINKTVAGLDFASAETVETMIANYGRGVSAWQNNEARVRSENDFALSEDIEQMGVSIRKDIGDDYTKLEGSFNDLRKLVVDNESGEALALRVDEMGVRITEEIDGVTRAYEGAIKTVEEARAKDGEATAQRLDTISSSVEGIIGPDGQIALINGVIQTIQETEARNDGARAEETKNLQSKLDSLNVASLEEKLSTYATKTDGIGAQYVLKVQTDVNGVKSIAGMGLAIEDSVSAISFTADSFRLTTPGSIPQQVFYADAQGVYMPNVVVDTLKAGSIDFEFIEKQSIRDQNGGYQILPGGLVIMWGRYRARITYEATFSVSFPIPFPNQCMMFNATPYLAIFNNERDLWIQNIGQTSRFGATVATQAARRDDQYLDGFDWIAFGY